MYIYNATLNNNSLYQKFKDSSTSLISCRFSYDNTLLSVGNTNGNIYIYQ